MAAGKEIKRLRESGIKKISAETLAGYMNVDAAKLRKWEQRNADPKVSGDKKGKLFSLCRQGICKNNKQAFFCYTLNFEIFHPFFLAAALFTSTHPLQFRQLAAQYFLSKYFAPIRPALWCISVAL